MGQNITRSLETLNVGTAFDAGIAIVIMAIVLDRLTTRASERAERQHRSAVVESVATPPHDHPGRHGRGPGRHRRRAPDRVRPDVSDGGRFLVRRPRQCGISDWLKTNAFDYTNAIKDAFSYGFINPMQDFLTSAPWWLLVVVIFGVALYISGLAGSHHGRRLSGPASPCSGLWEHSMETLVTVLVATVLTMAIGIALGILAANNDRASTAMRPFLDAAQTMPAFVYLLPALALFSASRFTAIVAALIFAVPPVIRLVENGIRMCQRPSRRRPRPLAPIACQLIWKVQLPVARESLLLASNQGIVLVLSMVVVGGLVGAGALGFDVVAGFSQPSDFGKGLAAGIAIVLLGIMLDRITQGAGRRRRDPAARCNMIDVDERSASERRP